MKRILIDEFIFCFAFSETLNFKDAVNKISKNIHCYHGEFFRDCLFDQYL